MQSHDKRCFVADVYLASPYNTFQKPDKLQQIAICYLSPSPLLWLFAPPLAARHPKFSISLKEEFEGLKLRIIVI